MQGQMIGEVGVFSPDGDIYDLYAPDGENELIDEQDKVVYSPSYLNSTYFDEIYHARTAYEIINSLPIYENTHPPLGKLIISLGILLFGMIPFGWRFMGTLFGILMLPVLFIIIKKAFGKSSLAVGGTVLLAADFMHFSLTRMATIDSYVTLFIMLSYLFMLYYFTSDFYEKGYKSFIPLGLCGLFFGLAISTKWIGFYSAVGLAVILIIKWVKAYLKYISSPSVYEDFIFRLAKTIIYCVLVL